MRYVFNRRLEHKALVERRWPASEGSRSKEVVQSRGNYLVRALWFAWPPLDEEGVDVLLCLMRQVS